jgi:hypothetical protein
MKVQARFFSLAIVGLVLVAASSRAAAPSGRYTVTNGTVYDTKTKLTWQQAAPAGTSYGWGSSATAGTAQNYCASLSLNGTGWRVPTLRELVTLVDYSQAGGSTAMIDPTSFPSAAATCAWTTTAVVIPSPPPVGWQPQGWQVCFGTGRPGIGAQPPSAGVRCVR